MSDVFCLTVSLDFRLVFFSYAYGCMFNREQVKNVIKVICGDALKHIESNCKSISGVKTPPELSNTMWIELV